VQQVTSAGLQVGVFDADNATWSPACFPCADCVGPAVPRLLINREVVGVARKSEVEW
jgi:hypothetical protein